MNKIIGGRLKVLRKNKGMSQEQVADFLHISQSAYARMEAGESNSWANYLKEICKAFDIAPEKLVMTEKIAKEENVNYNFISEKLIEQYEERIKDLKQIIEDLKAKNQITK